MATTKITTNVLADSAVTSAKLTNSISIGTLGVTGNLTVDTNTLFVDAANNRVGVGTASPSHSLTIASGNVIGFAPTSTQNITQTIRSDANDNLFVGVTTSGKRVELSGNIFSGSAVALGTGRTISFASNSGTWNGATIAGNQTFSANVTIPDIIGNTSFADDVEVLGEMTAPNQSLDNGSSVLTQELEERSFPNNLWIPWFFNALGRTGNRGAAVLVPFASSAITNNLINDIIFLRMNDTPWSPLGSGVPQRFSTPFSILFEADSNHQSNADKYFVIGKAASTDYLLLPQIGDDCISIKWINNSQIQLNIFYGGIVDQSDPITVPTHLHNKEKYLIVWDGIDTLYLYAAFWFGYNTMPKLSLLGSVSASGTLPLNMDSHNFYHAQHYIGPNANSSVTISSIFMNRKAIHPI